jgi:uncharacterized membrane protein
VRGVFQLGEPIIGGGGGGAGGGGGGLGGMVVAGSVAMVKWSMNAESWARVASAAPRQSQPQTTTTAAAAAAAAAAEQRQRRGQKYECSKHGMLTATFSDQVRGW